MNQIDFDLRIRWWIYDHTVATGNVPGPLKIAGEFGQPRPTIEQSLHRLADDLDAIVLVPGTASIWMAEPFSAVPTWFRVRAVDQKWWGNCIWDALAILALVRRDGEVETVCPQSAQPLTVAVANGRLAEAPGVVHFAVPARDWWRDIGFT